VSLEALAGAVLCVGLPEARLAPSTGSELAELAPGGVVLFSRNVSTLEATRSLLADARAAIGGATPALGCVDQEGGRVVRLRFAKEAMPSMMSLGATGDERLAERFGAHLAAELRAIGANVDFAPVLDLALEPSSTVIGTRSLGADPRTVATLGSAIVRGLQSRHVAATVKHFPGHGATALDSHVALPVIDASIETLHERELVPFAAAFAAGARAVMTAHIVASAIDAQHPATLSRRVLTKLLRDDMKFTGVCFTDCLMLDAIAREPGTSRGAVLALAAGADVGVISHDLTLARNARDAIVAAVRGGELPLERLEEAAARVQRLRSWATDAAKPVASEEDTVASETAGAALRVVRGRASVDGTRPVTVVSFEGDTSDGIASNGERPSLSLALRRRRVRSELLRVALEPDDAMRDMLLEVVRAEGERQVIVVARRAHRYAAQCRAIDGLLDVAPHAIVVSALEPFDDEALGRAQTLVRTYGDETANIEALADALTAR
jgi:beta-N-acetylhexosaminidase